MMADSPKSLVILYVEANPAEVSEIEAAMQEQRLRYGCMGPFKMGRLVPEQYLRSLRTKPQEFPEGGERHDTAYNDGILAAIVDGRRRP